jgi:hypothetical protein
MMAGKRLAEPTVDPMEAWRAFKQNTLMWARVWLERASCRRRAIL